MAETWSPKLPASTEFFTLDFERQLSASDSLTGCTCTITVLSGTDPSAASMVSGAAVISGTNATQKVTGGVSGCLYQLAFAATTALGETLDAVGTFSVGVTPDPADFTTVANLKAWIGLESSDDDALLQRLITSQSKLIVAWLFRPILSASYTDTFQATGNQTLCLHVTPVQAIASVTVDGQTVAIANDDVSIWRQDGSPWYGAVAVSYTGGYSKVPPDIEQACIELCALRYSERGRIGHQSKAIGAETVTYYIRAFPDSVSNLLNQYKRVVPW